MDNETYFFYNGRIVSTDEKVISHDNRSFKYGDGCFETMKMIKGHIIFEELHFERLFSSLKALQFDVPFFFTKEYLLQQTEALVVKNNHQNLARIRLTVFRGDGNLADDDNTPNCIVQSTALPVSPAYNENGFTINIYREADKSCNQFSNLKNNNYLAHSMAAIWGRKNGLDDMLIRNSYNRISEGTTSNVFIVKQGVVKTPALREGCVAGITRQYLLRCFSEANITYAETTLTERDILEADEMFLTNSGFFIQWVKQCGTKFYTNKLSKDLYQRFITPLLQVNEK